MKSRRAAAINRLVPVVQFVFNHTSFDPNNEMGVAALAALKTIGVEPGKQYDLVLRAERVVFWVLG